jgi:tRNA A37 methylthiotransferase MiaB
MTDNLNEQKKVYVVTNGCPENRLDVSREENLLVKYGFTATKNWHEADFIFFNACGRSEESAQYSVRIIEHFQKTKNEKQKLIVWGCLPKIDFNLLKQNFNGTIILGSELTDFLKSAGIQGEIGPVTSNKLGESWPLSKDVASNYRRYEGSLLSRTYKNTALKWESYLDSNFNLVRDKDPSIFYIKVSTGCHSNCAYCAIKKSRGMTKSKPVPEVVEELKSGLQQGFKKFSLLGTDLGSYGMDTGCTLNDLLKELIKEDGDFKISLRNVNPGNFKRLIDGFLPLLSSNKIEYFEMAAESGSDRIIKLMNRNYTIAEFKEMVSKIHKTHPHFIIRTQLIAGFPTETEEEFQETMKLLDEVVFDFVEVYEFSERKGTVAAKLEPKVPDNIKSERYMKLHKKAILNRTTRKIKNILIK